jgi:hypothetical protein
MTSPPAPGAGPDDLRVVVWAVCAVFAAAGFWIGASPGLGVLLLVAGASVAIPWQWALVARIVNQAYYAFAFAVLRLGLWSDDPGAVWSQVHQGPPPIGTDANVAAWQIAIFLAGVIGAYAIALLARGPRDALGGTGRRPGLMDRLMGSCFGWLTGLVVARFVLARLLPAATVTAIPVGGSHAPLVRLATVLAAVAVFVLYGIASLGSRRRQVFDG